jgi:hypothetical protein
MRRGAGLHRGVCAVLPGPHDPMTRPPLQVDKPVDGRDHHPPADQIAECHREQVVEEKSGPCQLGESLHGWAHPFEDVRIAAQEQGDRDEIHVGDRVLEAGRDKGRNRGDDRQHLVGRRACADTQPDGEAHQGITEDAEDKGREKAVVDFGDGNRHGGGAHLIGVEGPLLREVDADGRGERAGEIPGIAGSRSNGTKSVKVVQAALYMGYSRDPCEDIR